METIRTLSPEDWMTFRDFRLWALRYDPGISFSSYDKEAKLTPEEWRSRIAGKAHQVFGLFDGGEMVGITGVIDSVPGWREDPSGQTANLVMSFLKPEYRRRNLSQLFYDIRFSWILDRTQFARIQVSHRRSNLASQRSIVRNKFVLKTCTLREWPDGHAEEELLYEMSLADARRSFGTLATVKLQHEST